MVSASFDVLARHCDRMVIVLGHQAGQVRQALAPRAFESVSTDPDAELLQSIKAGLVAAMSSTTCRAILLHPADLPATADETVGLIVDGHSSDPNRAIMPVMGGKGGHPVLIPANLHGTILEATPIGGLRDFWRSHGELCRRIPVDDPGCIQDLDTPGEYRTGRSDAF